MSIPDAVMHFLTRLQHLGDKSYKKGLQASKNTSIDFNDIKDKVGMYVSERDGLKHTQRDGLKHTQRDGLKHTRALKYTPERWVGTYPGVGIYPREMGWNIPGRWNIPHG